jgi:hypothetical protein
MIRRLMAFLVFAVSASGLRFPVQCQDWTPQAAVVQDSKPLISYRARLAGNTLALEATLAPGWHTFSLDNAGRVAQKLAGKKPLSQDIPTEIAVSGGLAADGPWHQSSPKDFSRPQLRWYSWGYDEQAEFAVKARRTGAGPARIAVRGQVCDASSCRRVDLHLQVPLPARKKAAEEIDPVWGRVEPVFGSMAPDRD